MPVLVRKVAVVVSVVLKRTFPLLLLAQVLLLPDYALTQSSQKSRLQVSGSSTVAPLLLEIASSYEQEYPSTRIDIVTGGSSRGLADLKRGLVDIAMVSKEPAISETDLKLHLLARDGMAFVVQRENPLEEIGFEQIRAIFRGEITSWKEFGGQDTQIVVVSKAEGRATLDLFLEATGLQSEELKAHTIIGDNQQGLKLVMSNPQAITYVSIGAAQFELERGAPIKLLSLERVEATELNVRNGSYTFQRPLYLVTTKARKPAIDHFLQFATSTQVTPIVEEFSFVPVDKR